jgi:hypothetical protein
MNKVATTNWPLFAKEWCAGLYRRQRAKSVGGAVLFALLKSHMRRLREQFKLQQQERTVQLVETPPEFRAQLLIVPVLYCSVQEWKLKLGIRDPRFAAHLENTPESNTA